MKNVFKFLYEPVSSTLYIKAHNVYNIASIQNIVINFCEAGTVVTIVSTDTSMSVTLSKSKQLIGDERVNWTIKLFKNLQTLW